MACPLRRNKEEDGNIVRSFHDWRSVCAGFRMVKVFDAIVGGRMCDHVRAVSF